MDYKRRDPAMEDIIGLFIDVCLYDNEKWDKYLMSESLQEEIYSLVDSVTPSDEDLIRYYEDEFWEELKGIKFGRNPELIEWEEVRDAYYIELRDTVLRSKAYDFIDELETVIDSFIEFIEMTFDMIVFLDLDDELPNIGRDCPYGWASHSYETTYNELNFYVWNDHQVDGLQAVAVQFNGIWIYCAWGEQ